jgi:nicotinamide-nucleotide amidase
MNAEVLAVGTELLMGQITNTNAQYISNKLLDLGINVFYHSVVGDNPYRLKESIKLAFDRSDIVIMTGGLGPTQDDLTKEVTADYFGLNLINDDESLKSIEEFFKKISKPMVKSNIKQALMPEGSIVLKNNAGTAPGCIIENNSKIAILLPGPPREMKQMFEEKVFSYLRNKSTDIITSLHLKVIGVGESLVEKILEDLIENQTNPTIATYAKDGEVLIRISANSTSDVEGEKLINNIKDLVFERLGNNIFSTIDEELESVVGNMLIEKNVTISIAESCTGGLLSARLTNVPNISKVFLDSIVTYSNNAKINLIGVSEDTINKFGAVSEETAKEMAYGIRNLSNSDIGISITGIAGPGGGSPEKPVGLVYIAITYKDITICKKYNFIGDRMRIRNSACLNALDLIRREYFFNQNL